MLAVLRAVAARINPGVAARVFGWLRNTTQIAFSSWEAVWQWVKNDPVKAAIVAEGIYRFGAATPELIEAMGADSHGKPLLESLRQVRGNIHSHAESVAMGLSSDDPAGETARAMERQRLGRAVVAQFGSLENFMAVREAIETLKDDDIAWLRSVGLGRGSMGFYG